MEMGSAGIDLHLKRYSSRQDKVTRDAEDKPMPTLEADTEVNTRSAPRVKLSSKLVIDGQDLLGFPYSEDAELYDISQTGISFYLTNRPWIDDSLEITIFSSDSEAATYFCGRKARGRVVRTGETNKDRQFVAARFEN